MNLLTLLVFSGPQGPQSVCDVTVSFVFTALTVKFLTKRFIGEYDPYLGETEVLLYCKDVPDSLSVTLGTLPVLPWTCTMVTETRSLI